MVKKGAVEEVTVGDQLIRGTLKQPSPDDPKQTNKFTTTRVDDPKLTEELEARGVKYSGEVANRWLPELLGWIVPLIFFVAHLGILFPPHERRRRRRHVVRAQPRQGVRRR